MDDYLCDGENTLTVHLKSAVVSGLDNDFSLKLLQFYNPDGRYIRKPPHSYGWDIMPRAVTAGLWRDVMIEVRDSMYFSQAFLHTPGHNACLYYTIESDESIITDTEIELVGSCGSDSSFSKRCKISRKCGHLPFEIYNPKRWYPYGYGDAAVYDVYLRIYKCGELVHEKQTSFGIRDVVLDKRKRERGDDGQFRIMINGVEIMCKGTNWVPLDVFHSRDASRYDKSLELLRDIGCNIVRCWGGNVYEDHAFFDFCDRNGIMVWQDFAMACAAYPEDDNFLANLKHEVISVIRKLRGHPSLILWAGDNEGDDVARLFNPDTNYITRVLIPKCVAENDIGRPYLESSPHVSGEEYNRGIRSQAYGSTMVEDHLWGPRDYFKSDFYANNLAHFVSETGYHGCPDFDSVKKFITADNLWPYHGNAEWILHSTDQNGNDKRLMLIDNQVRQLFGFVPSDPETFVFASQISQAEADKYFIERMRVNRPNKTGIIWWNLIDGWPQISDAVVDYYYKKKIAYRYIKRSQAPFTIAAGEINNWNLPIYACNDTLTPICGKLKVRDADSGEVILECDFDICENTSNVIAKIPVYYSEQRIFIFEWCANGECGINHYLLGYPPISLDKYAETIKKYNL